MWELTRHVENRNSFKKSERQQRLRGRLREALDPTEKVTDILQQSRVWFISHVSTKEAAFIRSLEAAVNSRAALRRCVKKLDRPSSSNSPSQSKILFSVSVGVIFVNTNPLLPQKQQSEQCAERFSGADCFTSREKLNESRLSGETYGLHQLRSRDSSTPVLYYSCSFFKTEPKTEELLSTTGDRCVWDKLLHSNYFSTPAPQTSRVCLCQY